MKSELYMYGTELVTLEWGSDIDDALASAEQKVRFAFFGLCDAIALYGTAPVQHTAAIGYKVGDVDVREYTVELRPYFRVTCTFRAQACSLSGFVLLYEPGPVCDPPGGGIPIDLIQVELADARAKAIDFQIRAPKRDRLNRAISPQRRAQAVADPAILKRIARRWRQITPGGRAADLAPPPLDLRCVWSLAVLDALHLADSGFCLADATSPDVGAAATRPPLTPPPISSPAHSVGAC